jgi:hypothetical protein
MNRAMALLAGRACLVAALACGGPHGAAQPVPVRHVEGTLHGFLALRGQDGRVVAAGELSQVVRGGTVTARLVFHFRDGSVDDETTVFTERGTFRLASDHHIQQGPSFPKPMDLTIDVLHGRVTSRSADKDGKAEVKSETMRLPADLVNGMVSIIAKNIRPETPETKVSMVVLTPKPRVVTLAFSPRGEDSFSLLGQPHKGLHYTIKIELGGVAGMVAPLIGKAPPEIQLWVLGGDAPTFLRSVGPLFQDGPVWTMELASPDWPEAAGQQHNP